MLEATVLGADELQNLHKSHFKKKGKLLTVIVGGHKRESSSLLSTGSSYHID